MFLTLSTGKVFIMDCTVRIIGSCLTLKFIAIEAVIVERTLAFTPLPNPSDKTAIFLFSPAHLRSKTESPQTIFLCLLF